jgi:hypothetical protein
MLEAESSELATRLKFLYSGKLDGQEFKHPDTFRSIAELAVKRLLDEPLSHLSKLPQHPRSWKGERLIEGLAGIMSAPELDNQPVLKEALRQKIASLRTEIVR